MLEVGKLYRHLMIKEQPGKSILGCFVTGSIVNGSRTWTGGVETLGDITEWAGAMMLIEYLPLYEGYRTHMAIFLVGDRFVMLTPKTIEPV